MADGFKASAGLRIDGMRDLQRLLNRLPERARKTAMRQAQRAAGTVIVRAARAKVPRRTGNLRKSLGVRVYRKGDVFVAVIGARRGDKFTSTVAGRKMTASRYSHLVEKGTATMKARPFLRPALMEARAQAIKVLGDKLGKAIERQALKLAKKGRAIPGLRMA